MNMDNMTIIRDKPMMTQREIFWTTNFWHFLELEEPKFSIFFMHTILLRMINYKDQVRELWFRLNDVEVWFNLVEFVLLANLILEYDIEVSNYVEYDKTPRLKKKYFLGINKSLNYLGI